MTQSPAFQFYPSDFLAGKVGMMTAEEIGVYMMLLCLDWSQEGFPHDAKRLARWCRVTPQKFRAMWDGAVGSCFVERDGRMFNPRLEIERAKQAEYREKMAANGKKGGRPKAKPQVSNGKADANQKLTRSKAEPNLSESSSSSSSSSEIFLGGVNSTPPRKAAAADSVPSWPVRFHELLKSRGQFHAVGKVGALLQAPREVYGEERLHQALTCFLDDGVRLFDENPKFLTLAKFAEHAGIWVERITPKDQLERERRLAIVPKNGGGAA